MTIKFNFCLIFGCKEIFEIGKFMNLPGKNVNISVSVSTFLGWPITRVESSVAVIDETVRAVIKYMSVTGYTQDTNLRITISNFLGWNTGNHRILNGSKRILPYTKRIHERILFFLG